MSKILNTQLTGIFNRLEKQELDIQMAAQCLIQAIGGEGHVYIKGYDDLKFYESFILQSHEKLASSLPLEDLDVDLVLICNNPKRDDFPNHLIHYVNLSTPRPIVYTEDYDKIIQPHPMALNYIYYDIYTQMIEMTRDLDL